MTPQALRHFALVLGMTSLMISCASNPASKPESATRKMESALTARRPGEVTATTADPLQRLAYRYNTTNWSYGAAIDIDRDLAKADPEVAGIAGVIAARIDLAANLSAIGRLTEAQADLLEAERTIQGGGASLPSAEQRVLRVKLLIGRAITAGNMADRGDAATRTAGFTEAARIAAEAVALADPKIQDVRPGATETRSADEAIVLDPARTAAYNAQHRSGGLGEIISRPMSPEEKLGVLKIQAEYTQAISLLSINQTALASDANIAADADLKALPAGTFVWLRAQIGLQRAALQERSGDLPGAEATLQRALDALQHNDGASRLEAFVWRAVARNQETRGDLSKARIAENHSFDILTQQTDGVWPTRSEVAPYLKLLAPSATAGNIEDVRRFFEVASVATETQTANTVADMAARFASGDDATGAAIRRLQFARQRHDRAVARQVRLRDPAAKASPDLIKAGDADEILARQEVKSASDNAESVGGARAGAVLSPVTSLDQIQVALKPGEAYIRYIFLDDGAGYVLLAKKHSARVVPLGVSEAVIAEKVAALQGFTKLVSANTDTGADARLPAFSLSKARDLYVELLGRLTDDLHGVDRLTIEPAGPLFSLPFGALLTAKAGPEVVARYVRSAGGDYSGAPWLAREKAIDLSVGTAAFVRLRASTPSTAPRPLLAFANPTPSQASDDQIKGLSTERETRGLVRVSTAADAAPGQTCVDEARRILSFAPLPDTADEASAASTALGADKSSIVAGADFTDEAVRNRPDMDQYRILLFATHAALPEPRARCWPDPFLITSKAASSTSEGVLDTSVISGLKLNANLVVLSACNTDGASAGGQALGGLAESFIFAGSRGVIVSHWSVSSAGTASLMSRMFASLGKGLSATDALALAERKLMDEPKLSHPYYWAAFTAIGGVDAKRPGG